MLPNLGAAPVLYNFQTLNNSGDPAFNQLLGINEPGVIVGYFGDGVTLPNKGYTLSPPYGPSNYVNDNFPGSAQTQVVGINNENNTVGFWVGNNGNTFGFTHNFAGAFTSVSDPSTPVTGTTVNQLLGMNDSGTAVGFYIDGNGNAQAYIYSGGTFTGITLPASFNAAMTTATDINNNGVISGFYVDASGNVHGFVDSGGTFTSYDDPNSNGTNTMFLGLNDIGYLVGSYVDANGVTNGLLYNIDTSVWQAIDDPLQSATAAFGVTGTTVNGINDLNQLVGFYSDGTTVDGMLATPILAPEPGSFALTVAAMLGLARLRARPAR
jgi:hypothetical protein